MKHDLAWLILGIGIGVLLDGLIFDMPWFRGLRRWRGGRR